MRRTFIAAIALVLMIGLTSLGGQISCSNNSSTEGNAGSAPAVQSSSLEAQAWALIRAGALLVDVRTPEEFSKGHLRGAINIPYDQVEARRAEFGKDLERAIVVYCRSGRRSGIAEETLEKLGYTDVLNGGSFERLRAAE